MKELVPGPLLPARIHSVYEVDEDGTCVEVHRQEQIAHCAEPEGTTLDDSYARQRYHDARAGRLTMRKCTDEGWEPWRLRSECGRVPEDRRLTHDNTLTSEGEPRLRLDGRRGRDPLSLSGLADRD